MSRELLSHFFKNVIWVFVFNLKQVCSAVNEVTENEQLLLGLYVGDITASRRQVVVIICSIISLRYSVSFSSLSRGWQQLLLASHVTSIVQQPAASSLCEAANCQGNGDTARVVTMSVAAVIASMLAIVPRWCRVLWMPVWGARNTHEAGVQFTLVTSFDAHMVIPWGTACHNLYVLN